jgi:hypothetical protein
MTTVFLTTTGSGTWTVPSDWNNASNSIEVIGAGGGGAGGNWGGAGGGGAYSKIINLSLTVGASITIQVGVGGAGATTVGGTASAGGDTWFNGASLGVSSVGAKGGSGADAAGNGGTGGASASGVGTTKFSGGDGGACPGFGGGGGGGAAGPSGAGAAGGSSSGNGGSGGGGASGGVAATGTANNANPGTAGGNNSLGAGGGAGSSSTSSNGADGTAGGGGGGGAGNAAGTSTSAGGAGGPGTDWDSTHGAGGGAGGSGRATTGTAPAGSTGGLYGGGGSGAGATTGAPGGSGAQGIIVIQYTPAGGTTVTATARGSARGRGSIAPTQSTVSVGGDAFAPGSSPFFFAVELDVFKPGTSTVTINQGWATRPRGTLAQFPDAISDSTTIRASDLGYRSLASDSIGCQVYPPILNQAFAVDRRMNLDPAQPGVAAAWGSIQLSNIEGDYNAIASSWNSDGRNVKILYGTKTRDTVRGVWVDPSYATLQLAFTGVATPWFLTEDFLNVPIRDASYWIERLLQSTQYAGTGTYEGPAILTGVPKPKARGGTAGNPIKNVTPTLVDPTNRIYQYNDAAGTVVTLYEGGNAGTITFQANVTDLYTGTTNAGQYRTDNSRGLFQLGSSSVAEITADVTGAFPAAGAVSNPVTIVRYLLAEDMVLPSGNMDVTSFTNGATAFPYTAGVYFGSNEILDGATALSRVLSGFGGALIPTRTGLLRFIGLRAIPGGTNPVATFSTANVVSLTPQNLPPTLDPPPYRFRVGYNHNYTVQTTFLAAATQAQIQFAKKSDSFSSSSSGTVLTSYRRPNDPQPVVGCLLSATDAQTVANDFGTLWFTRRRLYAATVPLSVGLAREFGDVVTVVWPMDDLASGKLGQIVGEQFLSQDATITLLVLV